MIRASRRDTLMGAVAAPLLTGLPKWRRNGGNGKVLMLHDPALDAGRRLALAGKAQGHTVLAISGDPVRFTRQALEGRPWLVAGISRQSDKVLIEDVAREAGYVPVAWDGQGLNDMIAAGRPLDGDHALAWALAPRA